MVHKGKPCANGRRCHLVEAGSENAVLDRAEGDIHDGVEKVSPTRAALEGLGHDVFMVGQVCSAVAASVYSVARQK